ncbi:MAG: PQQ-dependent dehydrogenase, methanol/ethanol family [Betaproteobacteria bacterium]|nr:PQQ-dependent dehydrogenase, methanol/ethanol family [Betaproteobacteria bacterium]
MASVRRSLLGGVAVVALATVASSAMAQAGNEWPTYGGDKSNTRFSTLDQINTGNVKDLKVVWMHSLGSNDSQESTPIIVGDTMYVTSSTGPKYVFALNARTGEKIWTYQPELPGDYMSTVCCGLDNRGVAVANGMVFFGRLDAKLEALDAKTGKHLWTKTVADYRKGYAITSAPLIVKDMVITGMAGGEYGVRGFVSAYKQSTGELVWKTYTIPGEGEPENDTWKGDSWKTGGGSTWGVGAYDAGRNLVYWSTSNAGPWGASTRGNDSSDIGPYSNKWTSSQLAFDADTGKIVWGYQYTPHDTWDYDGINEAVLTELSLGGQKVPVMMHADRNGFFYVLNRETGKLLAADPFVTVNWASHVDLQTGRPVEAPNNEKRPQLGKWARNVCPNLIGGKNWSPMSYSPQTGLVYLPAFNMCMDIKNREEEYSPGKFYLASEFDLGMAGASGSNLAEFIAWDPVAMKKAWSIPEDYMWASGAMTTAGGLVFYGNLEGKFKAVNAKTGEVLWQFNVGTGITQSAVSYSIDGKQYIAVTAGRLKGPPSFFGKLGQKMMAVSPEGGVLVVFAL